MRFSRLLSRRAAPVLACVVAVALAACGGGQHATPIPFTPPDVALRNVQVRGLGITGGALDLELQVFNPNDYALQSPRVRYRVYVENVELASGFTDVSAVVPAGDSATVRVPATFGYVAAAKAGRAMANTGAAPYRVLGRITVGTPYGRLSFPYDRAGQFAALGRR